MRQAQRRIVALPFSTIFWAAALVRILFCAAYLATAPWEILPLYPPYYDFAGTDGHLQIARTLCLSGEYAFHPGDFPAHNRPPVTPLLMAAFGAWSANYWYVFWFAGCILLHLFALYLLKRIAETIGLQPLARNLLLQSFAFHPYLILAVRSSTFVNPAIVVLLLCVFAFLSLAKANLEGKNALRYAVFSGGATGLAALTHGSLAPLFLVGISWLLFFSGQKIARKITLSLALLASTALTVLPWTIRNYLTFNELIVVATGGGTQYWKGEAEYANHPNLESVVYEKETGRVLKQQFFSPIVPQDDAVLGRLAIHDVFNRPFHFLGRTLYSAVIFWAPPDSNYPRLKMAVSAAFNLPLLLIVAAGLYRFRFKTASPQFSGAVWLFIVVIGAVWAVFALLTAYTSYFIPLLPLLCCLAVTVWAPRLQKTKANC